MKTLIAVAVLGFALPQDEHEAEEWFRKMEAKLAKATSVQLSWKGEAAVKEGAITVKGELLLAEGNKARFDVEGKLLETEQKQLIVSDGKSIKNVGPRPSLIDTPKTFNETLLGCLARGGPSESLVVVNMGYYAKEPKPAAFLKVSAFKLGKKEKVDKTECQVIEFTTTHGVGAKQEAKVALWIDTATGLPVKRESVLKEMNQEIRYTETYSNFKLDERIAESKFTLPD
jgi:outer membrane lipoprotein-sorting protein